MKIWHSYRWRRRLAWTGIVLGLAGAITLALILIPADHGTHTDVEPSGPQPADTVAKVVKEVRVTRADRRALNRTLVPFVRYGVTRADPAAAWDLVTRTMHGGVTHKEWNKGQLPVFPFPAQIPDEPTWNVLTAFPGDVTIDLLLQPRPNSKVGPIAFSVEMKKNKRGVWLVDSMIPEQAFQATTPPAKNVKQAQGPKVTGLKGRLSPLWFIVPGVLVALIALVPLTLMLYTWRRNRVIAREYRAQRGL